MYLQTCIFYFSDDSQVIAASVGSIAGILIVIIIVIVAILIGYFYSGFKGKSQYA